FVPEPPHYHDTVVARAGVERTFDPLPSVEMRVRGGIFVEPTPAPAQTGTSNLYDNARVALSTGYSVTFGPPGLRLALATFQQLQLLVPREHVKAKGGQAIGTGGFILAGGTTLGVTF